MLCSEQEEGLTLLFILNPFPKGAAKNLLLVSQNPLSAWGQWPLPGHSLFSLSLCWQSSQRLPCQHLRHPSPTPPAPPPPQESGYPWQYCPENLLWEPPLG